MGSTTIFYIKSSILVIACICLKTGKTKEEYASQIKEMLQRASSNSYSWWWASHIRSKQSNTVDDSLQDVEKKVKSMLTLIEEEADSFAKKAEMYYRRRPDLIRFIQELYTSHRALAERFERVYGELQKSNNTLSTLFPDKNKEQEQNGDDEKKKTNLKKITPHMTKESTRREIYRLKKEIVMIGTEKEFIKNSYLNGLEKYHDSERSIAKIEEEVCELQDEFGNEIVVKDVEAQALMVITALRSCQEILLSLYEDQKRLTKDTEFEAQRIIDLAGDDDDDNDDDDGDDEGNEVWKLELKRLSRNISERVDVKKMEIMNIMELSEKIDVIVANVVDLESRKSVYEAHVSNLRSEIDDLESGKELRCVEKWEVSRMKQVHRCVHDGGVEFQSWFNEACISFNCVLDGFDFDFDNGKTQVKKDSDSSDSNYNKDEDEPDWEKLFKQGLEDREKVLLSEYTSILRNYKEVKKRLEEEEMKKKVCYPDVIVTEIRELKNCIQIRDEHIRSLEQILERRSKTEESQNEDIMLELSERENTLVAPIQLIDEQQDLTPVEERFRRDIDKILEENLQFWLRFTSSFDQVQKFQSTFEDILVDIQQLKTGTKKVDSAASIEKQVRDLQMNTSNWLEQNAGFKEELQCRFSSLCNIKEEISKASNSEPKEEAEGEVLSEYQAARFEGEVLIMAQENNTVAEELGLGLDHVKDLQEEVTKALAMLEYNRVSKVKINGSRSTHQSNHRRVNVISKTKLPCKLFIFNIKPLKPMKPLKLPWIKPQKQNSQLDVETAVVVDP